MLSFAGPNLNGLFGRQSGTAPGFSYPSGDKIVPVIWEENTLYDYLLTPKKVRPMLTFHHFCFLISSVTSNVCVGDVHFVTRYFICNVVPCQCCQSK